MGGTADKQAVIFVFVAELGCNRPVGCGRIGKGRPELECAAFFPGAVVAVPYILNVDIDVQTQRIAEKILLQQDFGFRLALFGAPAEFN